MNEPATRAGRWLLERSDWIPGLRAFRVRINATAGPDDMHRHILAIEAEASVLDVERLAQAMVGVEDTFSIEAARSWAPYVAARYAALGEEPTP